MDLLRHKPFRSYHIFQLSAQTLPRKYTQPFQSFRLFQLKKKKKKKKTYSRTTKHAKYVVPRHIKIMTWRYIKI